MFPQLPYDKKLHVICGFMLSFAGLLWWPFYAAGFGAGVLKEVSDKWIFTEGHTPDVYDIVWTWVGAAAGLLVCYGLCQY